MTNGQLLTPNWSQPGPTPLCPGWPFSPERAKEDGDSYVIVGKLLPRLANEAMLRAVRAADLSEKDKFEEVAKEWSALAEWAEQKRR